jgi:hypothetical protein
VKRPTNLLRVPGDFADAVVFYLRARALVEP